LKVEVWWKKALDRNIWGGSLIRPRSIKDYRAIIIIIIIIIIHSFSFRFPTAT
jgi:hypothetical protein